MITSTTELLNEIVGEVSSQGSKLFPCLLSEVSIKQRKEFATHYHCIQSWFLRSSSLIKLESLTSMMRNLSSIESLSLILNTLKISSSKSTFYSESQYYTNYIYDKALHDHSRSLRPEELDKTIEADLKWFKSIEDSEQIVVMIGLIRLSGGSIVHHIFDRGVKVYNERVQNERKGERRSTVDIIEIKPATPKTTVSEYNEINIEGDKKTVSSPRFPEVEPRHLNIKPDPLTNFEKCNPKDPVVIEVQNKRKQWDDMITKYRIQVEGKPIVSKGNKGKGSGKGSKGSKSDKSSKSSKSVKNSKKEKKSKGGAKKGKPASGELDRVQLLPIWIVKKIFSYLDPKTLKAIKKVNKYWNFAVDDLLKEQKARKNLNKVIQKMEENMATSEMQITITEETPASIKHSCDTSTTKKRLLKLSERGATLPSLTGKLKRPVVNTSLAVDATLLEPKSYILPIGSLETFSRSVARAEPLYKVRSCMVNELGFNKIYFDDRSEISIGTSIGDNLRFGTKNDDAPSKKLHHSKE